MPNGFSSTRRSLSKLTIIAARALRAVPRMGSSFGSLLRCFPVGDGEINRVLSANQLMIGSGSCGSSRSASRLRIALLTSSRIHWLVNTLTRRRAIATRHKCDSPRHPEPATITLLSKTARVTSHPNSPFASCGALLCRRLRFCQRARGRAGRT